MRHYLTAEISRSAVAHNLRVIRAALPAGCRLCAVVKADAYGHGLETLLPTLADRADAMAVATVPEGLDLRQRGYTGQILSTMAVAVHAGGYQRDAAAEAVRHGIHLTLTDPADVAPLGQLAAGLGLPAAVHVKVDTGMGRSGILPGQAVGLIEAVRAAPALRLAGVYTHFAASDEPDKTHAEAQFAAFQAVLAQAAPLEGVLRHAANSAAIAEMPQTALDMVRPGLAVYGYQPAEALHNPMPLKPSLRLTAPILQAKVLPAGSTCGYGTDWRLRRDTRIGIVPAGYGDGTPRALAGKYRVGVPGGYAPVLGRISMDQIIVDLTDHPAVGPGATVELISPDPSAPNSVAQLARLAGTIPYEITCRLGRRVSYRAVNTFADDPAGV